MELTASLRSKATNWSTVLRPRVGDVVLNSDVYYSNITGYNGDTTNINIWFPIGAATTAALVPITKTAADIGGADPFYSLDLTGTTIPALPASFLVWVDLNGTGAFKTVTPDYESDSKMLRGMNSPTDFPAQIIKIFAK